MLWMDIWVHPYTIIPVQVEVIFWKVKVCVRANGVVVSWLRLKTATDCIPHPYHMNILWFSTLICCEWTYRCTLTLLYRCKWGWMFGKLGCWWGQKFMWCHGWGYKQLQKASHIHAICIQSVLAPWYAVDGHMGTPLHCYTCVGGDKWLESWGVGESEWYCGVMVEATNSFKRHSTSISYVYKVF
jgi:hypothetical protein